MEIFKMYLGHLGVWFFFLTILTLNRKIKINDSRPMLVIVVFSVMLSMPSCAIQFGFFQ